MKIFHACADSLLQHGVDVMFGPMGDANILYVADYGSKTASKCSAVTCTSPAPREAERR